MKLITPICNAIRPIKAAMLPVKHAFRTRGEVITDDMSLVRSFNCKRTNLTISDETVTKLTSKFHSLLHRVGNSYHYEYLQRDLADVERDLASFGSSPAKRDLSRLAGSFKVALQSLKAGNPDAAAVQLRSPRLDVGSAHGLHAGVIPSHAATPTLSLVDIFARNFHQHDVSVEERKALDATFARTYGVPVSTLHDRALMVHDFGSIYRKDFKTISDIGAELITINSMLLKMDSSPAQIDLVERLCTYRDMIEAAERHWRDVFAQYTRPSSLKVTPAQRRLDSLRVREAATWLGWSAEKVCAEQAELLARQDADHR